MPGRWWSRTAAATPAGSRRTGRWPAAGRGSPPCPGRPSCAAAARALGEQQRGLRGGHGHEPVAAAGRHRPLPGRGQRVVRAAGTGSGRSPPAAATGPARPRPATGTRCRTGSSPRPRRTAGRAAAVGVVALAEQRAGSICPRSSSAACRAARMDENSPSVRPPAALDELAQLGQVGLGQAVAARRRQVAGDVQDAAARVVERRADVQPGPGEARSGSDASAVSGCRRPPADRRVRRPGRLRPGDGSRAGGCLDLRPAGRPHCRASGSNDPPSASVAEVSTTVWRRNRRSASSPPTSSGATRSVGGRRVIRSAGRSIHTTSRPGRDVGAERAQDPVGRLAQRRPARPGRPAPRPGRPASSRASSALVRTSCGAAAGGVADRGQRAGQTWSGRTSMRPAGTSARTRSAASPPPAAGAASLGRQQPAAAAGRGLHRRGRQLRGCRRGHPVRPGRAPRR